MTRELHDETRSFIRSALAEEQGPGRAHRERLRRGVLVRAAAGGVVTVVGSSVAKAAGSHSIFAMVASSVGIGFGAGLALAGAAQLAFDPGVHAAPKSSPVQLVAAAKVAPQRAPLVPAPAVSSSAAAAQPVLPERSDGTLAASAPSASLKPRPLEGAAPASAGTSSALRAELDLMAQVQGSLRDGQGARALELIARYDARHPSGVLETERLAAEVFAACETGDQARAQHAAARFLARDNVSALAGRVKNACASTGNVAP